jgi:hypothetical protein
MENKMPLKRCTEKGRNGWSWGSGKCYTYKSGDKASEKTAKKQAIKQGYAINKDNPEKFKKEISKSESSSRPLKIVPAKFFLIFHSEMCGSTEIITVKPPIPWLMHTGN